MPELKDLLDQSGYWVDTSLDVGVLRGPTTKFEVRQPCWHFVLLVHHFANISGPPGLTNGHHVPQVMCACLHNMKGKEVGKNEQLWTITVRSYFRVRFNFPEPHSGVHICKYIYISKYIISISKWNHQWLYLNIQSNSLPLQKHKTYLDIPTYVHALHYIALKYTTIQYNNIQ